MNLFVILDNSLCQGLQYGFLALGLFLSLRLLDFPDLTVEGSFSLGAAVTYACAHFFHWKILALLAAVGFGSLAGVCTGLLYTRAHCGKLLSGIIVSVGLYSINFRIMGAQANGYLLNNDNPFNPISIFNTEVIEVLWGAGKPLYIYPIYNILFGLLAAASIFLLYRFLSSERGAVLRFTRPESRFFLESIGEDYDKNLIMGLAMGNGFAALAGALVTLHTGSASLTMGFGIILIALVSVVLGELLVQLFHRDLTDLWPTLIAPFLGAIAYYLLIRLVQELNTIWQFHHSFPEPTSQFQYFQTDVKLLAVALIVIISIMRRRQVLLSLLPERL